MITSKSFKAKLVVYPEIVNKETKERTKIGVFTVGQKYEVYAVYDSGAGFTDFLVADNEGVFHWIGMSIFRAK